MFNTLVANFGKSGSTHLPKGLGEDFQATLNIVASTDEALAQVPPPSPPPMTPMTPMTTAKTPSMPLMPKNCHVEKQVQET